MWIGLLGFLAISLFPFFLIPSSASMVTAQHLLFFLPVLLSSLSFVSSSPSPTSSAPTPAPWPKQFHSVLFMNYSGALSLIDLWYDWPNGRNFNIIQDQLGGPPLHDLEWNNGTSFFYTLPNTPSPKCRSAQLPVGILRPNWLDGATYLGQVTIDGFLCNSWEKVEFIRYYEDVATRRPVHWVFYTGREAHVMTFEVGAALNDEKWQAPAYCFEKRKEDEKLQDIASTEALGDMTRSRFL
ncbi:Uncharacterized protein MA16_Dca015238 [Dendrobium catenatum]|uniref:Uncharacterized protein n=2 Tax=Dendrobium catenatum TaxID=906689 RepID=A0A2I0VSE9_9ASPA|nr:Uncharacterized protein MA16_Dca015238 [Dendrobium catenatum]